MGNQLRKTGIGVLGDVEWGTHFCLYYETERDLLDILVPYFKAGLENDELCLWVIAEPLTRDSAIAALREAVPEIDRYVADQTMEILNHDEWYLQEGVFDRERVLTRWDEKIEQALARGYEGLRINGNEAWLERNTWKDFKEYEHELNELISSRRMIVLCTYPLLLSAAELFDVASAHQFALATRRGRLEIVETADLKLAKTEIKRLNDELESRVAERTRELVEANEQLRNEIAERKLAETQLNWTTDQLRALSASLQSAREEEGTRIARELHDELGSALTGLKLDLDQVDKSLSGGPGDQAAISALREKIAAMSKLIDATLSAVRRISSELRPSILDDLGLVAAIEWLAQQFWTRSGILCTCDTLVESVDLSPDQATTVFRVIQEAFTNILRHARATKVTVTIQKEGGEFIFEIRDDGRGITNEEKADPRSLGLTGMHERVRLAGGRIEITGAEGATGTLLTVRVPRAGS